MRCSLSPDIQGGYFQGIDIQGCDNVTVKNCNIGKYSRAGLVITYWTADNISFTPTTNVDVYNNTFDTHYTFDYSTAGTYTGSSERGGTDGIYTDNCDGGNVYNNTFKNWGHSSYSVVADGVQDPSAYVCTNVKFYGNTSTLIKGKIDSRTKTGLFLIID